MAEGASWGFMMKRTTKFVAITFATLVFAAVTVAYAFPGPGMGSGFGPMVRGPGAF